MKQICMIIMFTLLLFSVGTAGEIFGSVVTGGKPIPKGTKIEITTAQKSYPVTADAHGSYRVFVPEKGKCTLKIYLDKQTPSMEISSYEKSTRYDLSVESKDGHYSLKRK